MCISCLVQSMNYLLKNYIFDVQLFAFKMLKLVSEYNVFGFFFFIELLKYDFECWFFNYFWGKITNNKKYNNLKSR